MFRVVPSPIIRSANNYLQHLVFVRLLLVPAAIAAGTTNSCCARTLPNFYVVVCIVCFVSFSVLFVCICVLYYCHRVATQLQLNISYHIISYHIISYHIISYHISHHITWYHIYTYIYVCIYIYTFLQEVFMSAQCRCSKGKWNRRYKWQCSSVPAGLIRDQSGPSSNEPRCESQPAVRQASWRTAPLVCECRLASSNGHFELLFISFISARRHLWRQFCTTTLMHKENFWTFVVTVTNI